MRDYDYMITVDRDGQPVLCHAGLFKRLRGGNQKGSERKDHKYLARIADKGKYLYFYTQQELNNYYNRGKRAVKAAGAAAGRQIDNARDAVVDKARDIAGYDERERYEKAQRAYKEHPSRGNEEKLRKAKADYEKTVLSKGAALKSKSDRMRDDLGKLKGRVTDKARDVAGYDERERLEKAQKAYKEHPSRGNEEKLRNAKADYEKTALSKAERLGNKARNVAGDVRDVAGDVRDSVRGAADRVRDTATDLRDRAADALGFDEREDLRRATEERSDARRMLDTRTDLASRAASDRKESGAALAAAIENKNESEAEYVEQINKVSALFTPKKNRELQKKYEAALAEYERALRDYQTDSHHDDRMRVRVTQAEESLDKAEADYAAAEAKYNRTVVGKIDNAIQTLRDAPDRVKTITAAQAEKLQAQLNAGKELAQSEMNQLMSFLFQSYKD